MTLEELKKQLETMIHYEIEQDIVDFPFNNSEFAPFVVCSFSRGIKPQDIPEDVLNQIDNQIKVSEVFNSHQHKFKPSFTERLKRWFKN